MRLIFCVIVGLSFIAGCTKSDATAEYDDVANLETEAGQREEAKVAAKDASESSVQNFEVGDEAPTFSELIGTDDKKHSLQDFKEAKAVAVVFTCNKCPVAVKYEDRFVEYQNDYADKGVQLVAINVNNAEADKLPAMKVRAEEKGFNFPYLYDESQQSARNYGAEVTPHIFLLDTERKLAYVGPMDDNYEEAQVSKKYLREATDAVLEGKTPETTNVEPVGCGIQYE